MVPPTDLSATGGNSPAASHAVAAISAAGIIDKTSTLSGTEHDNTKAMRLFHEYFLSLQQSETIRTIVEEKDLIASKLGIIFKKMKFITRKSDRNT